MKPPELARPLETAPALSVVIPTFRRTWLLETILEVLAKQITAVQAWNGEPKENRSRVEVIVVDNCPDASARETCERVAAQIPSLVFYHMPVPGVVNARNAGVSLATGDHVIFLDDDEIPRPGWLKNWLDHATNGVDAGFGPVVPRYEVEPGAYREILDRMFSRHFDAPTGADITRRLSRLGTGNSMFRRTRLNGARTFDLRFNHTGGEDIHMIGQLAKAGTRLIWNREAGVDEIVSADQINSSYLKRRRFNQAQLRCVLTLRAGGALAWPWIAVWMLVGVVQTVLNGTRYLLASAIGGARRETFAINVQGGLGKIFWYRRNAVPFYARALLGTRHHRVASHGEKNAG